VALPFLSTGVTETPVVKVLIWSKKPQYRIP